jgi:hypothetical protein
VKPARQPPRNRREEGLAACHELSERLTAIGLYFETVRRLLLQQGVSIDGELAELFAKLSAQSDQARAIVQRLRRLIE